MLVEVGDCICLVTDQVVEAVGAVGVDEAISDPLTGANRFVNVGDYLECGFYAVLLNFASAESSGVVLAGESQDIKRIFAS